MKISSNVFARIFIFLCITSFFVFTPSYSFASDIPNVGIIQKNIWYSKENLSVGDTIKIYTLIWNGSADTLTTTVSFFDSGVLLSNRSITLSAHTSHDVSIDWKVSSGIHKIYAQTLNSVMTDKTGKKNQVTLDDATTGEDVITISNPTKSGDTSSVKDPAKDFFGNTLDKVDSFRNKTTDSLERAQAEAKADMGIPLTAEDIRKLWNVASNVPSVDVSGNASSTSINDYENKIKDFSHATSVQELKTSNGIKKPLAYLKYYGIGLLLFIFSNKTIFYGACIVILFLILRVFFRRSSKK